MDTDTARDQVWQAIRTVTDPELDESIADLGFIQSVAITQPESADRSGITEAAVHITFRLPTYWCAANFAFMMAEDLRECIVRLPWAREVNIELVDHFTSDEINRGIAADASFTNTFPAEGGGNLAGLRRLFRLKAFQRRQYRLLRYLLDASHDRADLLTMTITNLRGLPITDDEGAKLRTAYLDILSEFSRTSSSDSLAFILPNGSPLDPDHLDEHLRQLRRTTINIEFNAALCTSLLRSRNNVIPVSEVGSPNDKS